MNIQCLKVNNLVEPRDVSSHRATRRIVLVVHRPECVGCGREPRLDKMVLSQGRCRDGEGRHRQQARSWVDLAAQVLQWREMVLRLVMILLVVSVPAGAVAAVLSLSSQLGLI